MGLGSAGASTHSLASMPPAPPCPLGCACAAAPTALMPVLGPLSRAPGSSSSLTVAAGAPVPGLGLGADATFAPAGVPAPGAAAGAPPSPAVCGPCPAAVCGEARGAPFPGLLAASSPSPTSTSTCATAAGTWAGPSAHSPWSSVTPSPGASSCCSRLWDPLPPVGCPVGLRHAAAEGPHPAAASAAAGGPTTPGPIATRKLSSCTCAFCLWSWGACGCWGADWVCLWPPCERCTAGAGAVPCVCASWVCTGQGSPSPLSSSWAPCTWSC